MANDGWFTFFHSEDAFRVILDQEVRLAIRNSHFLSLAVVKLEGPDEHKHLLSAVDEVHDDLRETDHRGILRVNKVGVILRGADGDHLADIISRISPIIRNHPICAEQGPCTYRLGIGGACLPSDGVTPDDLLRIAEENCRVL
jgi:hypothetical protein